MNAEKAVSILSPAGSDRMRIGSAAVRLQIAFEKCEMVHADPLPQVATAWAWQLFVNCGRSWMLFEHATDIFISRRVYTRRGISEACATVETLFTLLKI